MNFEFSADQMQLKDIARKFLEKEEAVKRARNVLEGEDSYDFPAEKVFEGSKWKAQGVKAVTAVTAMTVVTTVGDHLGT